MAFSPWRAAFVAALAVCGAYFVYYQQLAAERQRLKEAQSEVVRSIFNLVPPTPATLGEALHDRDGDLVADPPAAASEQLAIETLQFSYLASESLGLTPESWQPVMDALSEAIGIPVEYHACANPEEQIEALCNGDLHVTALNTGSVTTAVNHCGFVPVSALSDGKGQTGYSAMIITHSGSGIESPRDLKRLMFTSPGSNSGFRHPLLLLKKNFDLLPDRDYAYQFSQSHEASIRSVIRKEISAAAVASDVLDYVISEDSVDPDEVVVLYKSAKFPAACFGYHHAVPPEMAAGIVDVLKEYSFAETPLEDEFGASGVVGLAPVDFKEDFSEIRLIEAVLSGDTPL